MATMMEVKRLALKLPEKQRAALAAHLLGSLPAILHNEDEGISETLQRDAEFAANPALGMSIEQLGQEIARRRQR
jgi:hypothetical protein